jgi:hypothetical protein
LGSSLQVNLIRWQAVVSCGFLAELLVWTFEHTAVPLQELVEKRATAVAADSREEAQSYPVSLARHTDGEFIEAGRQQRGGDGLGQQVLKAVVIKQGMQRSQVIAGEGSMEYVVGFAVPLLKVKFAVVLHQNTTGFGTRELRHAKDKVEGGAGRVLSDESCGHDEQQENESDEG